MRSALLVVFAAVQAYASGVQILHGGGLELAVDLTGWTQEQGAAILHDNYARLGLFSAANGQNLSILVDDIPREQPFSDRSPGPKRSAALRHGRTFLCVLKGLPAGN